MWKRTSLLCKDKNCNLNKFYNVESQEDGSKLVGERKKKMKIAKKKKNQDFQRNHFDLNQGTLAEGEGSVR